MMKRNVFILVVLFIGILPVMGQTDKINFTIHYATEFQRYAGDQVQQDETVLAIGDNYSWFFSLYSQRRQEISDSVIAKGGQLGDVMTALEQSKYPRPKENYQVWKNYPSKGFLTFADKILKTFCYEETLERPVWNINAEDSTIAGYHCQKATTTFRGRVWTAWFTPEIPVSDGPWKLWGLPGVILSATDTSHLFTFNCIEINAHPQKTMKFPARSYIRCKRKEYENFKKLSFKDPNAFTERVMGFRGQGQNASGKPLVYPERTALFMDIIN